MKKLLLLLLLSLSLEGFAETFTYSQSGGYLYGSDGSTCRKNQYAYPTQIICDNDNNTTYGYTSAPMDLGYQSGEAAGIIINAITNVLVEGIAKENASKTKYNTQPTNFYLNKNDAKRGKYNAKYYQKLYDAKTGKYNLSNPTKSINAYNPLICIKGYIKTSDGCKKISNQTTSPAPISNFKTKKQYILGFSDFSDLLGFLLGLTFIGILYWWIFKDLTLNFFSAIKKFIARFINKN